MRRRSRTSPTLRAAIGLTLVSGLIVLLPDAFSNGMGNLLQILVPFEHLLSWMMPEGGAPSTSISTDDAAQLHDAMQRYENRLAVMQTRITELEQMTKELTGLRKLGIRGGRLIPANIVASDSLPWRESRLIDQGALAGVKRDAAVTSRLLLDVGRQSDVVEGMSVLAGEVLVAEVEQAHTHTSRVVLLTDPAARSRLVRIGRRGQDEFTCLPAEFVLHGIGRNRMEVRGVSHEYIDRQDIRPGDIVLASASDERLPVPLVVGRITETRRSDDNGVLYDLVVEPAVDAARLRRIWVLDQAAPGR